MKNLFIIAAGILLGIWFFVSKGTLLVLLVTGIVLFAAISRMQGKGRRSIMLALCLAVLLPRLVFSMANYYSFLLIGRGVDHIPDARAYSASGQYIAEAVTNSPIAVNDNNEPEWLAHLQLTYNGKIPPIGYRVDEYARYVGAIYSFFGYDPLVIKFINSSLSLFTALLIFFLVKKMFSFKIAVTAFSVYALMPSIFLWSVTGLKDPLVFFFTASAIYLYIAHLRESLDLPSFLLFMVIMAVPNLWIILLSSVAIVMLKIRGSEADPAAGRKDMIYFLAFLFMMKFSLLAVEAINTHLFISLVAAIALSVITFLKKRTILILGIAVVCAGILYPFYKNETISVEKVFVNFSRQAISRQSSQVLSAHSSYRIYPEEYYDNPFLDIPFPEFAASYLKGAFFALFTPHPFTAKRNISVLVASIQMLFIYLFIPFAALGLFSALRYKWRDAIVMIFFVINTASLLIVSEGNVGTVFRHRDVLTAFFAICVAIGIGSLMGWMDERKEAYTR